MLNPSPFRPSCTTRAQRLQVYAGWASVYVERPASAPARQQQQQQQQQLPALQPPTSSTQKAHARLGRSAEQPHEHVKQRSRPARTRHSRRSADDASSNGCSHSTHTSTGDMLGAVSSSSAPTDTVDEAAELQDTATDSISEPRRRRRAVTHVTSSSTLDLFGRLYPTYKITAGGRVGSRRRWSPLHSKLLQSLRREQLIPQHARVLLAVSGGQDSMAMLVLLHDLSQQQHWPLQLVVAHCDHRVRPDSDDNAAHVQRCCEEMGLPYTQAVADRPVGHWPEAAARQWRHEQLVRMAAESGCEYLALGHTATERAETVLFNMIRGAGVRGLSSMGSSRPLPQGMTLVRPLLEFTRPETLEACERTRTRVYPDSTNQDPRYMRNLLRLSVFPVLDSINSSAVHHICSAAELLRAEWDLLQQLTECALEMTTVMCSLVDAGAADSQAPFQQEQQELPRSQAQQLQQEQEQRQRRQQQQQGEAVQAPYTAAADPEGAGSGALGPAWQAAWSAAAGQLPEGGLNSLLHGHCRQQVVAAAVTADDQQHPQPWLEQQQQEQRQQAPSQQAQLRQQQEAEQQELQQQRQLSQPEQAGQEGRESLHALHIPTLSVLHPALQRRVLHLWLSKHSTRCVKADHVLEAERLLGPGYGSGARTSSLFAGKFVLRFQQLLMVLDRTTTRRVRSGELLVQRAGVSVC